MPQRAASTGIVTDLRRIPGLYLQKLLAVAARHGISRSSALSHCDFRDSLDEFQLTEMELEDHEYLKFVNGFLERFDIPGLGLKVGRMFQPTDMGILGYALISARTLGFAMRILLKYEKLIGGYNSLHNHLAEEEGLVSWEAHSRLPPGRLQQFQLEESLTQFTVARDLLVDASAFQLVRAEFPFPDPGYADLYEEVFHCPVLFEQQGARLVMPKRMLECRFNAANELATAICQEQCRNFLLIMEDRGGVTEQVRSIILNSTGELPQLTDVAELLNTSVRTIRRRLKSENTSFKEILTDVRMRMAKQYLLETPLSIKEIGYLLSYAEVANFHRAFKNWYKITPRQMRLEHAQSRAINH